MPGFSILAAARFFSAGVRGRWAAAVRRWTALGLKGKLVASFLLLAILVLAGISHLFRNASLAVIREQARRSAEEKLELLSSAAAEAVAAADRLQLACLADALIQNGAQAVRIRAIDGRELLVSPADGCAGLLDLGAAAADGVLPDGSVVLRREVEFGGRPVGLIDLCAEIAGAEGPLREASQALYLLLVAGLALFTGLCIWTLHSPFRALKRLALMAERLGDGKLSERVPVQGRDEVSELCRAFNAMAEKLESARQQVILKQLETIEAMINAIEAKDPYTQGHCLRVGGYAREILDRCSGLSREQVFEAQAGAILHDIGKIGVPDHILLKRGALTDDESAAIERHVIIGENILAHLDSTREVARSVRHHHERWDGGGYPDGLRGEEIPFASRVISVADAIDALLTDRPYRRGKSIADVMTLLERERGRQFDPVVADHALSALRRRLETSPNAAGAALAPAALVAVE